jgi:NAD(P)-dependent dehydrogenase (short-subunit alcohol dehydrogenase family)
MPCAIVPACDSGTDPIHPVSKPAMTLKIATEDGGNTPQFSMGSLPDQYHALVVGSSGTIGAAITALLRSDPRCGSVQGLHRHSQPPLDFADESGVAVAASELARGPRLHLVVNATGMLHAPELMPEKRLADLDYAHLLAAFRANTFGPALLLRHIAPLLAPERGLMAMLSAKVGSIGDNRLGGWYSYRASKAALNMLVRTAAIELARTQPNSVLVSLHPGTVESPLSRPFRGAASARPAHDAAVDMLRVLDRLVPSDSGAFFAYDGSRLPW